MEALENIRARRSIRKYTEEKVTPEDIRKIVETAAFAPSWMNVQTAGYIAVLDETLKNDISVQSMQRKLSTASRKNESGGIYHGKENFNITFHETHFL